MHEAILRRMRELVRARAYVMTLHADEEAAEDEISLGDIEDIVLTGLITHRQRDRETNEWKYVIRGEIADARVGEVVAKIGVTGKLYILTVYED